MRRLFQLLSSNAMESVGGFLLLGAGAILTFQDGPISRLGDLLLFFSGIIFSWAVNRADVAAERALVTREITAQVQRDMAERLTAPVNHAATATGQVERALNGLRSDSSQADTALQLIAQANESLIQSVSQVAVHAGVSVDPRVALETARGVLEAADHWASTHQSMRLVTGSDEETVALHRQIEELRAVVERAPTLATRQVADETAPCPDCSTGTPVRLGTARGDTAHAQCPGCALVFFVHRDANGGVFTRYPGVPGPSTPRVRLSIPCPSGKPPSTHEIPLNVDAEFSGTTTRFCLACYEKVVIRLPGPSVESHESCTPVTAIRDASGGSPVLLCGACKGYTWRFAVRGDTEYASCGSCGSLNEAKLERDPS